MQTRFDEGRNGMGRLLTTERSKIDALVPQLPNGANVAFAVSAVAAGFRGGRNISAEASLRGEWEPGGSASPARDAYVTPRWQAHAWQQ